MPAVLCAEREGFEPSGPFRAQHISSVLLSTTQPPLQDLNQAVLAPDLLTFIPFFVRLFQRNSFFKCRTRKCLQEQIRAFRFDSYSVSAIMFCKSSTNIIRSSYIQAVIFFALQYVHVKHTFDPCLPAGRTQPPLLLNAQRTTSVHFFHVTHAQARVV